MIQDLIETLDRSWSALTLESDVDFPFHCFPFHERLLRDPRTSALLADFRREERESRAVLQRVEDDAVVSLRRVLDKFERQPLTCFDGPPTDEYLPDDSAQGLRQRLVSRPRDPEDDVLYVGLESDAKLRVEEVLEVLVRIASKGGHRAEVTQLRAVQRALHHAKRVRRTFHRTSAGTSLARFERDLLDLHPPVADEGDQRDIVRGARRRSRSIGHLYAMMYGDIDVVTFEEKKIDPMEIARCVRGLRADLRHVYDELRRRIGTQRSLLAVMHRYRHRCEWYEAANLRAIARAGSPEARLVETLTTYLFDQGLNPLTRPMVGTFSPDLLAKGEFSFYVEAKQYASARTAYLRRGINQVWHMLDRLRHSDLDVTEAFYIVYRRGGPQYSFPPSISHDGRIVHVIVVDVAAPEEGGSRAPETLKFTVADLLPRPASSKRVSTSSTHSKKRRHHRR